MTYGDGEESDPQELRLRSWLSQHSFMREAGHLPYIH